MTNPPKLPEPVTMVERSNTPPEPPVTTESTPPEPLPLKVKRVPLTDGSGRWFNENTAQLFVEDTRWDGRNRISVATGSEWYHQALYYTASKKWILNCWSNYQGSIETYGEIPEETAAAWLVQNDHEHPALATLIDANEI